MDNRHRRGSHVVRIYKTDDDGKVVDNQVWIDVLRIDRLTVTLFGMTEVDGQMMTYYMDWGDDIDGPKARTYSKLKIKESSSDDVVNDTGDDFSESLTLPIIHRTRFVLPQNTVGSSGQGVKWNFHNKPGQTGRKITPLRITSNDLGDKDFFDPPNNGDPQPVTNVSGKGSQAVYPVLWDTYAHALQAGDIDDTEFVDIEAVNSFKIQMPSSDPSAPGQNVKFILRNRGPSTSAQPIGVESLFHSPPGSSTSDVYRIDPFQIIVNVSWGGLAVQFMDGAN